MMLPAQHTPSTLFLGQVKLINDNQMFLEGMGHGIDAYFLDHRRTREMTAQQLISVLTGTLDRRLPFAWRLGFVVGLMTGLLHPDGGDEYMDLPYLEAFSRKCEVEYQGFRAYSSQYEVPETAFKHVGPDGWPLDM
ncbi:MAG: hypothetical protein J2P36_21890 [Ktedonobacteraceae bacterium]|nr:hypothetical protein [Ktedonobacteraceae bacterium]